MMGKVDLAATILELVQNQPTLKFLQEKSNLSRKELEAHLKTLVSRDLVKLEADSKKIEITKRGVQFLELYKSIHSKYLTVPA